MNYCDNNAFPTSFSRTFFPFTLSQGGKCHHVVVLALFFPLFRDRLSFAHARLTRNILSFIPNLLLYGLFTAKGSFVAMPSFLFPTLAGGPLAFVFVPYIQCIPPYVCSMYVHVSVNTCTHFPFLCFDPVPELCHGSWEFLGLSLGTWKATHSPEALRSSAETHEYARNDKNSF